MSVKESLNRIVASCFILLHRIKRNHWLVQGDEFLSLHVFLDEVTDEILETMDKCGERLIALGGTPDTLPGMVSNLSAVSYSSLKDYSARSIASDATEAIRELYALLREGVAATGTENDYSTEQTLGDLLTEYDVFLYKLGQWIKGR